MNKWEAMVNFHSLSWLYLHFRQGLPLSRITAPVDELLLHIQLAGLSGTAIAASERQPCLLSSPFNVVSSLELTR